MSQKDLPPTLPTNYSEECYIRFEAAWRACQNGDPPPSWKDYLPPPEAKCPADLILKFLKVDITCRIEAGLPALLSERYFEHPRLQQEDARLDAAQQVELIAWEYQQRWQHGQRAHRADYEAVFPQHADALHEIKPCSRCPRCGKTLVLDESLQTLLCRDCGCESELLVTAPPLVSQLMPVARDPELDLRSYQLIESLGEGGMGEVYRCGDPALDRDLAIKVIKASLRGTPKIEQRFLREARVTGSLQHPGIVPIHNLGRLADGRLHYTMRLVRGRTFAAILKDEAGKPERLPYLLSIFEKICQAAAYAHSKRVIHRDLKPSNIMVGRFGEVQVMDWGLAKVLGAEDASAESEERVDSSGTHIPTEATTPVALSRTGAGFGTPAYMPVEQALGEWDSVDERADVFALGSILCEILTGQPAYWGTSGEEVSRRAKRGDVSEAWGRLEHCGADAALVALCRECLSPQREDRPRDAGVVTEEIARLRAASEERARAAERERAAAEARAAEQKRKRRWQLAAAGTVVLALLLGLGGLAVFLRAQAQANADLKAANQREHERFELALDAIKTFHTGVSEDTLLKEEEFKDLRERLLREAAQFYGKLHAILEGQTDAVSQRALAQSYFLLAKLTRAIGSIDEALALHRKALALRRTLAAQGEAGAELDVARSLLGLAETQEAHGDFAEAGTAAEEALGLAEAAGPSDAALDILAACHESLASLSYFRRDGKKCLHHSEQCLEFCKRLADSNPSDNARRRKLAIAYAAVDLALFAVGKRAEAFQAKQRSIEIMEELARASPGDANLHDSLAIIYNNKGSQLQGMGKLDEAVPALTRAVEIAQKAVEANPAVGTYKNNLSYFSNNLGNALQQQGRSEEALQAHRKAAKLLQPLADAHATTISYGVNLARSRLGAANALAALGKSSEAVQELDWALSVYRKLVAAHPTQAQSTFAEILRERGSALHKLGRPSEAVAAYREAITLLEKMTKPRARDLYDIACYYALIHGIAREKGSGWSKAETDAAEEKAMAALSRAVAAGFRHANHMRHDSDLDSLRKRPDFEKLLTDLEKEAKR